MYYVSANPVTPDVMVSLLHVTDLTHLLLLPITICTNLHGSHTPQNPESHISLPSRTRTTVLLPMRAQSECRRVRMETGCHGNARSASGFFCTPAAEAWVRSPRGPQEQGAGCHGSHTAGMGCHGMHGGSPAQKRTAVITSPQLAISREHQGQLGSMVPGRKTAF